MANVKQLETKVVLKFYCLFSEYLGVLASKIQQFLTVFKISFSLAQFWRAFGILGGVEPQPPPVRHCAKLIVKPTVTSNHQVKHLYRTEAASNELNGTLRT